MHTKQDLCHSKQLPQKRAPEPSTGDAPVENESCTRQKCLQWLLRATALSKTQESQWGLHAPGRDTSWAPPVIRATQGCASSGFSKLRATDAKMTSALAFEKNKPKEPIKPNNIATKPSHHTAGLRPIA